MLRRRSHRLLLLVLPALLAGCLGEESSATPPAPVPTPLHPDGPALRDDAGRQVLLHGVNIRAAGIFDPSKLYLPMPKFTADDCRRLADDFGMNFIRFPVNWSLLEPTQGHFDPDVIAHIKNIIADCHAAGIYMLVDLHQDGWSRFVGDDGAPLWAHAPPLPPADGSGGGGSEFYQSDINKNYQAFYDQKDGLQADYLDMLGRFTAALRGVPGIVGIEIMNEPIEFPPSGRLWAFYQRAVDAIRSAWPDVTIFFEPDARRNLAEKDDPPGTFFDPNAVYAPHIYTGLVGGYHPWKDGDTARIRNDESSTLLARAVYGTGLVIGEMGSSIDTKYGYDWARTAFGVANQLMLSWSAWLYEEPACPQSGACWGFFDMNRGPNGQPVRGKLRPPAIALFAQPFPHAVPGNLVGFAFNRKTRVLTVNTDGSFGTFELAAPRLVYPDHVKVLCGRHKVAAKRSGGVVRFECGARTVELDPAGEPPGTTAPYTAALTAVQGSYPWSPN